MKMRKIPSWILMLLALSLVAAACSGSDDTGGGEGTTDSTEAGADAEGGDAAAGEGSDVIASVYIGEPESLTPLDGTESNGIEVMQALFTGLVTYDPESSEPVNAVAESIETEDNQTFTVTLKEGWTFHSDGN